MMSCKNTSIKYSVFSGLLPGKQYDLIIYVDLPAGKGNQGVARYRVLNGAWKDKMITMQEANAEPGPEMNYDFVRYMEANEANKYTGNYLFLKDIQASAEGTITLECLGIKYKDDPRAKRSGRPGYSGLQLIYSTENK